jgi:hypothetical protein
VHGIRVAGSCSCLAHAHQHAAYATGVAEHETREELGRLLALSSEVLPRLVFRATEILEDEDLVFDYGYVYRVEGGF